MPQHPVPPSDLAGLVAAFAQTVTAVVELGRGCSAADFARPTECPGWNVQDQVSHIASLESVFAGEPPLPVTVPDLPHVRSEFGRFMEAGVHARRAWTGARVVEELAELVPGRVAALSDPSLTLDSIIDSAIGPRPAGAFVALRVSDVWCHEQDIRAALGMPLALDTPGAAVFTSRVLDALPVIVARDAALPVGTTVVVEVVGPVSGSAAVRVQVGEDGRPLGVQLDGASQSLGAGADGAGRDGAAGAGTDDTTGAGTDGATGAGTDGATRTATTRITLSTEAFTRRGAGRRDVDATRHTVVGDPAVARAVLEHLAITP